MTVYILVFIILLLLAILGKILYNNFVKFCDDIFYSIDNMFR